MSDLAKWHLKNSIYRPRWSDGLSKQGLELSKSKEMGKCRGPQVGSGDCEFSVLRQQQVPFWKCLVELEGWIQKALNTL